MTALALVAVLVLVLLNGVFVAAEFAIVRVRRSELEAAFEDGRPRAAAALRVIDDVPRYLSACQLGITLTSLGIGFLGEPAVAALIEPLLGELPEAVTFGIALFVAYVVTTSLHITIGEQVPKIFAINRAEGSIRRLARPLLIFSRLFNPFIRLLNGASNAMLRWVGIGGDGREWDEGGSPEELKSIIAQSLTGGQLDADEASMLTGVFHLHDQQARQVMTPAPAVVTVDTSEPVETALRRCVSSGHTRLVVTEDENQDRIRGIVHSNALARQLMAEGPQASIEELVRPTLIIPETKALDELLADLQRERASLAIVIDEYGRTIGVVTIEDIVEEVVGEVYDETDPQGGGVRQLANGDWFVRGHVAIDDLADHGLHIPTESDAYNSVGGFVFGELGRLPRRGDTVTANGYSIRVENVRENRIEAVRIRERRAPVGEPRADDDADR